MKTFPQKRTPVHSWHRDKHGNRTMYGKRRLSNLPIWSTTCTCANKNQLYLSPFNI